MADTNPTSKPIGQLPPSFSVPQDTRERFSTVEVQQALQLATSSSSPLSLTRRNLLLVGGGVLGIALLGGGIDACLHLQSSKVAKTKGSATQGHNIAMPTLQYNQNGLVYFGANDASTSGHLYAIDMGNGQVSWNYQGGTPVAMTITDQVIYLLTSSGLFALNTKDGSQIWQLQGGQTNSYTAPLTVNNGMVYALMTINSSQGLTTQVQALHSTDGSPAWQYQASGEVTSALGSQFVIGNEVICIGIDMMLYTLRIADGSLAWQYPTTSPNLNQLSQLPPSFFAKAAANGIVYTIGLPIYADADPNYSELYALRVTDGTLLWKHHMGPLASIALDNSIVYVNDISFYALQGTSGRILWQHKPTGAGQQTVQGNYQIIISQGTMYSIGVDNALYALHISNGTPLWYYAISSNGRAISLTLNNGIIYVGTDTVSALRASDGHLLWQSNTPCDMMQVIGNVVYCWELDAQNQSENSGLLYALGGRDGSLLWKYPVQAQSSMDTFVLNAYLSTNSNS